MGCSPVCETTEESGGCERAWLVREEERSCILVLLPPSEGEAAGLWPSFTGDWRDDKWEEGGGEKGNYFRTTTHHCSSDALETCAGIYTAILEEMTTCKSETLSASSPALTW